MKYFFEELKFRNETLFTFGLACFIASIVFLGLSKLTNTQVMGVSAWFKPFKFAASTMFYAWSMAWYCHYLQNVNITLFNWSVIILLGFEIFYIALQAGRGQLSHYNVSSPMYAALYSMMALAASAVTLYTAYIGLLFFAHDFPDLPTSYIWSIRLGIVIFVIFSFEGFVMGSRMTHTIGGADGGNGIPILNWSTKFGDPRVAHFIGMHALQVLPILSYYLLKEMKLTIGLGALYAALAVLTLLQALQGKSFNKL